MGDRDPEAQLVPIRGEKKTCLCGFYADSGSQHAQNPRFLKEPPGEKQFPRDLLSTQYSFESPYLFAQS